jgi:hypothetical protein
MKRLSDAFESPIEIVIVFREQWSFLRSLYSDYIKAGLCLDFNDYIKTVLLRGEQSILGYLNYGKVIQLAETVGGKVHCFFFEDMRESSLQGKLLATFGADDVTEMQSTHSTNYNVLNHALNRNRIALFYHGTGYESDMYDSFRLNRMDALGIDMGKKFIKKIQSDKLNHTFNDSVISSSKKRNINFDKDVFFHVDDDVLLYLNNKIRKWNMFLFEKISRDLGYLGYLSE